MTNGFGNFSQDMTRIMGNLERLFDPSKLEQPNNFPKKSHVSISLK